MSKLYRIKPLEWEEKPTINLPWPKESTAAGYRVYQAGTDFDAKKEMIVARNPWGWPISDEYFDSIEAAKAACEAHRRRLLEAELELVYEPISELPSTNATMLLLEGYNKMLRDHPTTELPTEPGLYWFKDRLSNRWVAHKIEERLGTMAVIIGGDAIFVDEMQGQWARIPEPEEEK